MKNTYKIAMLLLMVTAKLNAQERSNVYTNLLHPFAYNPSLAGSNENIQATFNTRGIAGGIEGSPRNYNFGVHSPISTNMGLGAKFISTSVGVFQTINAEGAYSKVIKLNDNHTLRLGLSMGFTQTNIKTELLNRQVDLSDPALSSNEINHTLFTSGIGFHYKFGKKAEAGLSLPALITGDRPLNNMMIANAAWNLFCGTDKQWRVKPMVNFYKLNTSPNMGDGLLQLTWKDVISVAGGYRSNGSAIAMAGINFKSVMVNYAYYNQISGMNALAPVQNEIAVSFGFNKIQASSHNKNEVVSDEVIQDEIDKLTERLNGLVNIDKTNPGLVNMKKEVSKLNKDLGKVLSRYKITNSVQIQKVKNLQGNLETLITKYND